jgi:class 3 adenylate cyclase/uncharacterized protein YggT (Ycf19 family)
MKKTSFSLLAHFIDFIRICILIFTFLIAIGFVTNFLENPAQYRTLMKIITIERQVSKPIIQQIKMVMPYKFNGIDYSALILIILMLFLAHICTSIRSRFQSMVRSKQDKKNYNEWRKKVSSTISKERMSEIDSKFEALSTTKASDRKVLLKEFAALKIQLDKMGQQLAFLAIDVVDSTGMKRDEDKHLIAYDFDRYNQVVNNCLKENGVIKYAMTPDGIMSCFRTVDDAVNAAVTLFEKLKEFNLHERQIKSSFQIRCGINAGFVYIDDETPLEQVSDRVIDIAGHMQKYAKPDSINIAASAIEPLKNRGGFSETTDIIDEQKVYEWSNK